MRTMFFDTNIWNYLIKNSQHTEAQMLQARERLVEGVRNGEWEVICSLSVLQEILGTYRKDPIKYEAIRSLVFTVVDNRWLLEIKERYVAELLNGGLMLPTSRYIGRENRRKIERLASNKKDIIDIGDITHKEALEFKDWQEEVKRKIFTDLGSSEGKPPKKIAQVYEKWFADARDLEGWVYRVLEGGVARRLFSAKKIDGFTPSHVNCPSAWQYVDFRQAKILLNLGHNTAIKSSDAVDADIYGCSPYYEVLVTEDEGFKDTIELIVSDKLEIRSFKQLMSILLA